MASQLPPADDSWFTLFNAIIAGASAIGGGVAGGALVIWRAATLSNRVTVAEKRLAEVPDEFAKLVAEQAKKIEVLSQKIETEITDRHKMHVANMDMMGMVRREVVLKADKKDIDGLRQELTERLDRIGARMEERFDRLIDHRLENQ